MARERVKVKTREDEIEERLKELRDRECNRHQASDPSGIIAGLCSVVLSIF